MSNKNNSWKPVANPELAKAMRELRRSGATSPHDSRPHRQRTRQSANRAALREYGW